MKHIQKLLLMTAVVVLGFSSCTREDLTNQGGQPTDEAMLTITADGVNTRATTEAPTADERKYTSLDIYYFDVSAGNDRLIEHTKVTAAGSYPFIVKMPQSVISNKKTAVYVIASPVLTGGGTLPTAPATTTNDIASLNLTGMVDGGKLAYITDARKIPMSGSQTMTSGIQKGDNVKVEVRRSVAKLRVKVVSSIAAPGITVKETLMTIAFNNLRTSSGMMDYRDAGTLLKSQTFGAADAVTADPTVEPFRTNDGSGNSRTHYAYINEHVFDPAVLPLPDNRATININLPYVKDGNAVDYNLYIAPLDFSIKRNFIYDVTVTIVGTGKEEIRVDVSVKPWDVVQALPGESGRGFSISDVVKTGVAMGSPFSIYLRDGGYLSTGDDALADLDVQVTGFADPKPQVAREGNDFVVTGTVGALPYKGTLTIKSKSTPEVTKSVKIGFE